MKIVSITNVRFGRAIEFWYKICLYPNSYEKVMIFSMKLFLGALENHL
jgi:hypothetical protein